MKKAILLACVAVAAAVACNKNGGMVDLGSAQELGFNAFQSTKGYVETALFADTPYNKLHRPDYEPSEADDAREMFISSYIEPQSGIAGSYFRGNTFKRDDADGLWHNFVADVKTPIYWPIGGKLNFLALSITNDIVTDESSADCDLRWNNENVASSFTLNAGPEFKQDDILFASHDYRAAKDGVGGLTTTVDLEFQHAQAWIQFQLNATQAEVITIKKIELLDIYERGYVTVMNNVGKAVAKWDFREETRKNVLMDDTYEVTNNYSDPSDWDADKCLVVKDPSTVGNDDDNVGYMDMLIPEQPKTKFLITYTLAGQPGVELTYLYDLAHENWLMGHKYIYKINFGINEITVDPEVKTFADGNVDDFSPVDPDVVTP